jgi:hypothetical protein
MPASEPTATAQHEPIVVHVQWDTASVWQYGLGGSTLLVCVMLLWLAVQLRARDRVRANSPWRGDLLNDPDRLEVLQARAALKKQAAKIDGEAKRLGLR